MRAVVPHTEADLPPAWLAILEYPNGTRVVARVFATQEDARRHCASDDASSWCGSPTWAIEEDRPSLRVRVHGIDIATPQGLTVRRNWLLRHKDALAPYLKDPRTTHVFTFEEGPLHNPLATRLGGPPPLPRGMAWPVCGTCGKELAFVGVLDFRGTPEHAHVPGDALVFHFCTECPPLGEPEQMSLRWINERDPPEVACRASGLPLVGTRWAVPEYPNDDEAFYGEELQSRLGGDQQIYSLITCLWATKISGHVPWIQSDETPECSLHGPMRYVGQFFGGEVEFGDSGVAYVFVCTTCGLTTTVIQCF